MGKTEKTNNKQPAKGSGRRKRSSSKAGNMSHWNPAFWAYRRHVALTFDTEADLDEAIEFLWTDDELWGLPRVHVGRNTMIVPKDGVEHFKRLGCKFTIHKVRSAGDLSPEEINKIRRHG
jgi:hypothetical protein